MPAMTRVTSWTEGQRDRGKAARRGRTDLGSVERFPELGFKNSGPRGNNRVKESSRKRPELGWTEGAVSLSAA